MSIPENLFAAAEADIESSTKPKAPAESRRFATNDSAPSTDTPQRVSGDEVAELVAFLRRLDRKAFAKSLVKQYDEKGGLTPRQVEAGKKLRAEIEQRNPRRPSQTHSEPPATAQVRGTITIPDGKYTIVFPDETYRTLDVFTVTNDEYDRFRPGETYQKIAFLSGPDNTSNYTTFAETEGTNVRIWKRFRDNDSLREAVRVLVADPKAASAAYGLKTEKCGICGHELSVPESIARGIGPKCAERFGY